MPGQRHPGRVCDPHRRPGRPAVRGSRWVADGRPAGSSGVSLAELLSGGRRPDHPLPGHPGIGADRAQDTAIFVGIGGVGGFGVQIAKSMGALVLAVDVDPEKLEAIAAVCRCDLQRRKAPRSRICARRCRTSSRLRAGAGRSGKSSRPPARPRASRPPSACSPSGPRSRWSGSPWTRWTIRLSNLMAFHATRPRQLGLRARALPGGAGPRAQRQGQPRPVREDLPAGPDQRGV
ncbi:MAG: hypothetical protein MZV70_12175 [Desulfobacterales bacterium]|nr:hypothetical protein [Desulfobacterales bacterium]